MLFCACSVAVISYFILFYFILFYFILFYFVNWPSALNNLVVIHILTPHACIFLNLFVVFPADICQRTCQHMPTRWDLQVAEDDMSMCQNVYDHMVFKCRKAGEKNKTNM
jgi:hypothetical protein